MPCASSSSVVSGASSALSFIKKEDSGHPMYNGHEPEPGCSPGVSPMSSLGSNPGSPPNPYHRMAAANGLLPLPPPPGHPGALHPGMIPGGGKMRPGGHGSCHSHSHGGPPKKKAAAMTSEEEDLQNIASLPVRLRILQHRVSSFEYYTYFKHLLIHL